MTAITNRIESAADQGRPEPLFTIRAAATAMGLKYWLLLRAVNEGTIPSYRFGSSRLRVRLSEIEAAIQASRT